MSEDLNDDFYDEDDGGGGGTNMAVAVGLPAATVIAGAVAGLVVGVFGTWLLMRGEPEIVEVPRDYSEAELATACQPLLDKAIDDLQVAEEKVNSLEGKVTAKAGMITDLEAEMKRRAAAGKLLAEERNALRKQLETAKAELVTLEKRLSIAIEEKELLTVELHETKEILEEQKYQTHVAKEDALDFKWKDFIGQAQLEVCDRGNRKKLGNCRGKLEVALDPMKDKFDHCVRSGQAVPDVRENPKSRDPLPQFAAYIDQDHRITKDWFILLCDPTLPEAKDEFSLPAPAVAPPEGDLLGDLEDLDD